MEYAMLKLEDLQLELGDFGLVSATALIPEIFALDLEKSKIQANYLYETIKNLQKDELSETEDTADMLDQMHIIEIQKRAILASKGLPSKIMVMKLSQKEDLVEVYESFSERTMYTKAYNFQKSKVNSDEKEAYLRKISLANINGIDELFRTKQK